MSETPQSLNAAAPAPLRLLLDGIERLGRLDGWIGAACLVTLTLLMLAEITVRALSNFIPWVPADIPVAWEYSSYLMAACFTFGAAMTLRAGGHIRVTLVLGRLDPAARRLRRNRRFAGRDRVRRVSCHRDGALCLDAHSTRARPRSRRARCCGFPKP